MSTFCKIVILTFIPMFFSNSCFAQWYERQCAVTDLNKMTTEEYDCLWKSASTTRNIGLATTALGSSLILAGGITMITSDPCCSSARLLYGYFGLISGVVIDIIGIPLWSLGSKRRNEILPFHQGTALRYPSLRVAPSLHQNYLNHSYSIGFKATLSF